MKKISTAFILPGMMLSAALLLVFIPGSFAQKKKTAPVSVVSDPSLDPVNIQKAMDEAYLKFKDIKEGKNAVQWTKLSCRTFKDNQTRLQLFALAYNLGNFLRRLALPKLVRHWSLTTLREKLIKIGAKVTWHSKYVFFQLAEVAVTRNLFAGILDRIARLAIPPPLVT